MKHKMINGIILMVVMLSLAACANSTDGQQQTDMQEQQKDVVSDTEADEDEGGESQQELQQNLQQEPINILVYHSNDDATAFDTEEVEIESLAPENIMAALADNGAVAEDIEVISFKKTEADGKPAIDLDLSESFAKYVSSMGSTGEYYAIGSIGNTFLQAYDCVKIRITVEGNVLETGHAEYPGYLTMFE